MWTAVIAGAAAGLASVPHCTAMCGPLAAYACSGHPGASGQGRYQLGRFISYSALGAVAGRLGSLLAGECIPGVGQRIGLAARIVEVDAGATGKCCEWK